MDRMRSFMREVWLQMADKNAFCQQMHPYDAMKEICWQRWQGAQMPQVMSAWAAWLLVSMFRNGSARV